MKHYRIRPCNGNRQAWLLVRIDKNGKESQSFGSYTTAMSLDHLLAHAKHLTPQPGDRIDFITREQASVIANLNKLIAA